MWALSKENILSRTKTEIEFIYNLLHEELPSLEKKCLEEGIAFRALGNLHLLPEDIQKLLLSVEKNTQNEKNLSFLLMLGYSGQDEIIR